MNNPIRTRSDGQQLQRNFYTPYFMDFLTGRNRNNIVPNIGLSQGMQKVSGFFGNYDLYLNEYAQTSKPYTQEEQERLNEINRYNPIDTGMVHEDTNQRQYYNMPYSTSGYGGLSSHSPQEDLDKRENHHNAIKELKNSKRAGNTSPSRWHILNPENFSDLNLFYMRQRKQRDVGM